MKKDPSMPYFLHFNYKHDPWPTMKIGTRKKEKHTVD